MRLFEVTLESLRADKRSSAATADVQEEVFPDVGGKSGHLGRGMVTEQAGEGALRAVDQQVALPLQLVLKAPVTGGTVVQELSLALPSL